MIETKALFRLWSAALIGLACLGGQPAWAGDVGVVLLHGKWGSPGKNVNVLASALQDAGYKVATPEMPWSGQRQYDKGVDEAMREIDSAVASLRQQGANRIFVAGHSLGAAAAVRFGGRSAVDGLIVLAPGHFPEGEKSRAANAEGVARARAMVAAGQAEDSASFLDQNTGDRSRTINMRARVLLDYQAPDGPMNFLNNAAAVRPGVPVLWVTGKNEAPGLRRLGQAAYEKLPRSPEPSFLEVDGGHEATPTQAIEPVLDWLKAHSR